MNTLTIVHYLFYVKPVPLYKQVHRCCFLQGNYFVLHPTFAKTKCYVYNWVIRINKMKRKHLCLVSITLPV